jgi:hypothetical protein
MDIETEHRVEGHEVIRWRLEQLAAAGVPAATAIALARDAHYDLHALIDLIDRGCPVELAVRILAPLDAADAA